MYRDSVPGGWKIFLATLFAVVAAFTIMAGAGAGRADAAETITDYRYTSEPGDYIGSGGRGAFTSANSTISISGTNAYLTVNITNGNERWSVDLAAPRGEKLRPGKHYDAERAAFRTGLAPGLDVSGNGRGCNEVWGQFSIRQISADSTGKVTMLEATFIQHCESARAPALKGTVRFNARPLTYSFTSDAGDWIGGGISKQYFGDTTTFSLQGDDTSVSYSVSGRRDDWNIDIRPPTGQRLQPGTYDTARFAGTSVAGLDVSGNGRGCNASRGRLTIRTITFNTQGTITSLNASFIQRCDGDSAALRGTIRHFA